MTQKTKSGLLWTLVLVGLFIGGVIISKFEGDPNITAKAEETANKDAKTSSENEKEEVKNTKDVVIESLDISKDSTGEDFITIILKNNTDKVLKDVDLGIVGYDKDGKPVNFNFGNDDIYIGRAENLNLQPSETKKLGWTVYPDGELKEVKACVDTYEFEGSKNIANKYYKQWREESLKDLQKQTK